MASDTLDRVAMLLAETGNSYTSVVANQLIADRFNTPAEAGAANGKSYWWMIEDNSTDYMIFEGTWTAVGTLIAIDTIWHSKISGVHGTTKVTLSGSSTLRSVTPAEIFGTLLNVDKDQSALFSATQKARARSSIYAAPFDALAYNGMQVNGSMEVSQANGTTAINTTSYITDAWSFSVSGTMVASAQQVTDAPPGYSNSIKISVTTAQASLGSADLVALGSLIEGNRVARLAFGSGNPQPVTIGFWTKIHRVGTYSGSIRNGPTATRSYPFSFTQNVADTWEFKTVTIPGDTTGTWVKDSGIGLNITFAVAAGSTRVGTANAWSAASPSLLGVTGTTNGVAATSDTFQVTGVIVLPGIELPSSDRAPFIMRPFDQELMMCQRYYEKTYDYSVAPGTASTQSGAQLILVDVGSGANLRGGSTWNYKVQKRTAPTVTFYSPVTGASGKVNDANSVTDITPTTLGGAGVNGIMWFGTNPGSGSNLQFRAHIVADSRL